MRMVEAARLIMTGQIQPDLLWQMTTTQERVTVALLLGRPDLLPPSAKTPTAAWDALDTRQRNLLLRRAPARVRCRLPGYVAATPIGRH
jgi:hypothetical protein